VWMIGSSNTGVKQKKGFCEVSCALFRGANGYVETISVTYLLCTCANFI
jgi:hypothetical protein